MDFEKPRMEFCEYCGALYVKNRQGYDSLDLTEALKEVRKGICWRPECQLRHREEHWRW